MSSFIVSSSSPRAQRRLDPGYHQAVEDNAEAIAMIEGQFSPEEMISRTRKLTEHLDVEGWKHLAILTRSNDGRVDKESILRGVEEDPSLALVLARQAAEFTVARMEQQLASQEKSLDALRGLLVGERQSLSTPRQESNHHRVSTPKP